MRRFLLVSSLLALVACGDGEGPPGEATSEPKQAAPEFSGTLVVSGDAVESPASHDVEVHCDYGAGVFSLSAYNGVTQSGNLNVMLGGTPDTPRIPFEDGTYTGRFSYDEPRSDGRVLSYRGDAEVTIEVVDESGDFPVARVVARGATEGIEIEMDGRCAVLGG